jgi:Tfp pilus assembly protein PilV
MMSRRENGDTLVEVLLAMAVLGIAMVGVFAMMNRGVTEMYDSMERTQVRGLIDQQIETLIYARDQSLRDGSAEGIANMTVQDKAAATAWGTLKSAPSSTPSGIEDCSAQNAFYMNQNAYGHVILTSSVISATSNGFPSAGDGVWVQKNNGASGGVSYVDLYVRACWGQNSAPGTRVLSSVVRLYDK